MMVAYGLWITAMRSWNWEIKIGTPAYWLGVALLVVVLLFALVLGYREWQEIHDDEEPDSPDDLLQSFREAHALGELDDEEMRRVERRLASPAPSSGPSPAATGPDSALASISQKQAVTSQNTPQGKPPDAASANEAPGAPGPGSTPPGSRNPAR